MEEKEISLKQNVILAFLNMMALVIFIGSIASRILVGIHCPDIIVEILDIIIYIGAIVAGFFTLKDNNRIISFSEDEITIKNKRFKKIETLLAMKKVDIESVYEKKEDIIFMLKDDKTETVPLSYSLKPLNKLRNEVKKELYIALQDKANDLMTEDLKYYIENSKLSRKENSEDIYTYMQRFGGFLLDIVIIFIGSMILLLSSMLIIMKGLMLLLSVFH